MKLQHRDDPARVEYFDAVRKRLLDVPWPQRQRLLSDLASRLDELPSRAHPVSVLGDDEQYARLMREAAGFGPAAPRRFAYIRAWRPRRKIFAVVTVVAVAAAAVGIQIHARREHWRTHYQPLVASEVASTATARSIEANVPTNADYWKYKRDALVVIGARLANHGSKTVTVTGFLVPRSPYGPIVPTALRLSPSVNDAGMWKRSKPIREVAVHPGEEVVVFVVMKIVPWKLDGFVTQPLPTLTVDVMGTEHSLPIEGTGIGVSGPGEPHG